MKKNLILIGIFAVLVFGLAIFTGCAEKKTVVTDGSAQEQKVAAAQTADTTKEQPAKVQAAETAVAVNDINFDFDKSNIRPDAREILKTDADVFLKNSASNIVIEGHCDERGTTEYNMALGQRRAQETKKYLVNLGIKESRMKTISYGEERPLDPGHNEDAWARNRRAHFAVTP
ncbi:MAG TPA: peptidoglycan-associated lipoprotein Pal [Smithellaceae bacterium]